MSLVRGNKMRWGISASSSKCTNLLWRSCNAISPRRCSSSRTWPDALSHKLSDLPFLWSKLWTSQTFDLLCYMIIDIKRFIDLRWLFDPVLLFIIRHALSHKLSDLPLWSKLPLHCQFCHNCIACYRYCFVCFDIESSTWSCFEGVATTVFRIVLMVDFSTIINKKVILTCSSHYFFKFTKKTCRISVSRARLKART